ncbi:MAG: hypothetical protein E7581_07375 [Ruminococcaceae bacterium]|nr:hypothetical protein [Oscillospiraceae bacterium]
MKILRITAANSLIRFETDADATVQLSAFSSVFCQDSPVYSTEATAKDGCFTLPMTLNGYDGRFLYYRITEDGKPCTGACYCEDMGDSPVQMPYPVTESKKGLQVTMVHDAINLGVKHAALNVNLGSFLWCEPVEGDTIPFDFDGETFYFRKTVVEQNDARVKELTDAGVIITYILLNAHTWGWIQTPDDLWEIIKHPGFCEGGRISAFNLHNKQAVRYYMAWVAFLTERYTLPDAPYGRAVGLIVGNEVNSGFEWCNMGEATVEQYVYDYTASLRLCWQVSTAIWSGMRTYISLDHFWTGANFSADANRFYGSKFVLKELCRLCHTEGQIGWHVAHHPYPENLNFPDFWNDESATVDENTYRITFKNLEVLAQFLYREEYLFCGERRRIILSEQGFNSHNTATSEVLQAMAYGKAYRKVMEIPEIDSFILHAHQDNMGEFGLNLGLWRRRPESSVPDSPKPIYFVFRDIDKKDEKGVYHWQRY